MGRVLKLALAAVIVIAAVGFWVTRPVGLSEDRFSSLTGDASAGEAVFWASGCASCHAAEGPDDEIVLAGGHRLVSDFGTFISPNISPDPVHGIGEWTLTEFAAAMLEGTSPSGQHYYPAFPYASYTRMSDQDVADLWAYMATLPASDQPNAPHELSFPYSIRLAVGGWKLLYMSDDWIRPAETPELARGRYLVEALGHCAECHTPRDALGGLDQSRWMAGAPNPSGRGNIPGLSPQQLTWSSADIEYYLETGFTPDFDSAGGGMASVVRNLARLPHGDRTAITAYIKALPPVE